MTTSELTCFNRFIKTLVNYQEQITNYFIERHTSGFVEGFNNRVKVLKRRCNGLSGPIKLFQRLPRGYHRYDSLRSWRGCFLSVPRKDA
ncbi:transposase [Moritella sp. 36]|uniref:transposase n=1 Tax=Moritella sp. 36 TaxID=2746233 RepID=UPI001BA6CF33|nr:transposase [Moritella sp. 36]